MPSTAAANERRHPAAAYALENLQSPFGIADVQRLCPNVSREMIRVVLNRWREEGRLEVLGRGRDAKWRRLEPK